MLVVITHITFKLYCTQDFISFVFENKNLCETGLNSTHQCDAPPKNVIRWYSHDKVINTLRPEQTSWIFWRHFQIHIIEWILLYIDSNCSEACSTGYTWQLINTGSCDSLMPSGNKILPGPVLMKICGPQYQVQFHAVNCLTHLPLD